MAPVVRHMSGVHREVRLGKEGDRIGHHRSPRSVTEESGDKRVRLATGYRTSTTGPPIAITMCRDIPPSAVSDTWYAQISVMGGYPLQPNSGRHSRRLLPLLDRVSRRGGVLAQPELTGAQAARPSGCRADCISSTLNEMDPAGENTGRVLLYAVLGQCAPSP